MASRLPRFVTVDGVLFRAPDHLKASPLKANAINNYDPRKHGLEISNSAKLDRKLQGDSSMGTSILVDFEEFKRDVLPGLPASATKFGKRVSFQQKKKLFKTFAEAFEKEKPTDVSETTLTEIIVGLINSVNLPNGYKATTSCYKADHTDPTRSKVDAALYADDHAPKDGTPDWTQCRLYIEFKKGGTSYDPFDDRNGWNVESMAATRAQVRAQLIAYAWNVFLYQHRAFFFSLLIIGDCFRVLRWDRSGVIVSKKVNYVEDPEALLGFLWHFVQLDDVTQGLDPTAKLISEGSKACELMNHLAKPNPDLDMDDSEGTEVPAHDSRANPAHTTPSGRTLRPRGKLEDFVDDEAPLYDLDSSLVEFDGADRRVFKYIRNRFAESINTKWPRYKLKVGPDERIYLVGKPIFRSSAMFGRATRGYLALDVKTRQFVFLKDSWRPFYVGVQPGGDYLEEFAQDTSFVHPTLVCHGDVKGQSTFTPIYETRRRGAQRRKFSDMQRRNASSAPQGGPVSGTKRGRDEDEEAHARTDEQGPNREGEALFRHHIHYRIVVKEVCLPFESFRTAEQLIRFTYECITAHSVAYSRYKIMHRDVSAGNVLILPRLVPGPKRGNIVRWYGFLTDWELAKPVAERPSEDTARQPERTGTRQFMSVAYVVSDWSRPIEVADELESFFHVMLFYAVRFLRNNLGNVGLFVLQYFDTFQSGKDGRRYCSPSKLAAVRDKRLELYGIKLRFLKKSGSATSHPLNTLVDALMNLFEARYKYLQDLIDYEQPTEDSPQDSSNEDEPLPWRPAPPVMAEDLESDIESVSPEASGSLLAESNDKASDNKPEKPKSLDDHAEVLELFRGVMWKTKSRDWVGTGVVPADQLVNYEPRILILAMAGSTMQDRSSDFKRRKTQHGSFVSVDAVVVPATVDVPSTHSKPSKADKKGKGRRL
ncbi:hypothetical protein C8Q79DRAFT_1014076 [Trametes meyenii]|nr:hypothetical protein C8Q79DRAFT_1014076 [Trametes meyenii]